MTRYEIFQSISQGENGTLPRENAELARIANDIIRAATSCGDNEKESRNSTIDVICLNEKEQRAAEAWALKTGHWNEIDCYMAALGFEKIDTGKFKNEQFFISDLLPKNVLKDKTGDVFVIDAEIDSLQKRE